jgi:hypothetical protein
MKEGTSTEELGDTKKQHHLVIMMALGQYTPYTNYSCNPTFDT